jgi:hypothetical protein
MTNRTVEAAEIAKLAETSVNDIADSELVRRVVAAAAQACIKRTGGIPLWSKVGQLFCLGSGYSAQLCRRYGYDPQLMVRR